MDQLPTKLLLEICELLPVRAKVALQRVSRQLHAKLPGTHYPKEVNTRMAIAESVIKTVCKTTRLNWFEIRSFVAHNYKESNETILRFWARGYPYEYQLTPMYEDFPLEIYMGSDDLAWRLPEKTMSDVAAAYDEIYYRRQKERDTLRLKQT